MCASPIRFCYYVDNSVLPVTSASRGVASAYGTFTATGPVARDGRQALLVQSINGVRTVLAMGANGQNTTTNQGIIALKYNGADRFLNVSGIVGGGWNKNYVFTSGKSGPIDYNGVLFTLTSNVVFASGTSVTTSDADLWWITPQYPDGLLRYIESPADESENINTPPSTNALFQYAPFNPNNAASASFAACSLANPLVAAPAPVTQYSFCFYQQSSGGAAVSWTTGVVSAYGAAVTLPGSSRAGYVISNITGVRAFSAAATSFASVTPLVGAAGGWQGAAEGYSAAYLGAPDQLLYTAAPYLDSRGVLVNYAGGASSTTGAVFDATVVRFYYDAASSSYVDQSLASISYTAATNAVQYIPNNLAGGTFNIVNDNGASGTTGLVGQTSCGQPTTQTFQFCYQLTGTQSGGSGWSIRASGTLTINTAYNATQGGFRVVGASGTRSLTVGGSTWQQNIVGVAPAGAYLQNDNVIANLAGSVLGAAGSGHSISLQLDGAALTAPLGTAAGASFVNLNNATLALTSGAGFTEAGAPINDGASQSVSSSFVLQLQASGVSFSCPQAPTATAPAPTSSGSSSGLSGGAIAGIVIGVAGAVLLLLLLLTTLALLKRQGGNKSFSVQDSSETSKIGNHVELAEHSKVEE